MIKKEKTVLFVDYLTDDALAEIADEMAKDISKIDKACLDILKFISENGYRYDQAVQAVRMAYLDLLELAHPKYESLVDAEKLILKKVLENA